MPGLSTTEFLLPRSSPSQFKRWLSEKKYLEALLYLGVCGLSFVAPFPAVFERPIPYQVLPNSGDVVLDLELNNPYIEDKDASCPVALLLVLCLLLPLLVCLGYSVSFGRGINGDTHAIFCAIFLGLAITEYVTTILKVYVGRLRPNFYQMCKFDTETLECSDDTMIHEGRTSFPSGHTSLTFNGMSLISLYISGKLHYHFSAQPLWLYRLLSLAALSPYTVAIWVGASRIHDYWHHPSDVCVGALIGVVAAHVGYLSFFPGVESRHLAPFPLRKVSAFKGGKDRGKEEEEHCEDSSRSEKAMEEAQGAV